MKTTLELSADQIPSYTDSRSTKFFHLTIANQTRPLKPLTLPQTRRLCLQRVQILIEKKSAKIFLREEILTEIY